MFSELPLLTTPTETMTKACKAGKHGIWEARRTKPQKTLQEVYGRQADVAGLEAGSQLPT